MLTDAAKTIQALTEMDFTTQDARAGWHHDPEACLDAKQYLNISHKIRFRLTGSRSKHGSHQLRVENSEIIHLIYSRDEDPIEKANEALWHEMAHAMQAEAWAIRTGHDIWKFYRLGYNAVDSGWYNNYRNNGFEIHAQKVASLNRHKMLLIKG